MSFIGLSLIPAGVESTVWFLALGSVSAMVFSMAKAGFGGGVGLLAVPLMIMACGETSLALGIMLPMLIVADYVAMVTWWRRWQVRRIVPTLPGVVVGIALGALAIRALQGLGESDGRTADAILKTAVGVIAVAFVVLQIIRHLRGRPLTFRPKLAQACGVGATAGFTSTLAHAAGPIATMYFLPQKMPKQHFVATVAMFFWIANQAKLVPYFALGMINTETLGAGVALLPAIAVGALLGKALHNRLNAAQFSGAVHALLALAGGNLIHDGVAALFM